MGYGYISRDQFTFLNQILGTKAFTLKNKKYLTKGSPNKGYNCIAFCIFGCKAPDILYRRREETIFSLALQFFPSFPGRTISGYEKWVAPGKCTVFLQRGICIGSLWQDLSFSLNFSLFGSVIKLSLCQFSLECV